jgi:hypothetical protein
MNPSRVLQLSKLAQGLPGVSPAAGAALMEAALVCLTSQEHQSGVELTVGGDFAATCRVEWATDISEQVRRTWADMEEATEAAACGIAFMLMLELTDYTVVERSRRGTGFDYWLDDKDSRFLRHSARLEVSGIMRAVRESDIEYRLSQKVRQVEAAHYDRLPAYIIVVEFSRPAARIRIVNG